MPYLYYLRNIKQYCNYCVLIYTAWCNVKRTVQARIQMQLIAKVLLSQKSPCSYDCCHTFIEVLSLGAGNSDTHPLSSMTEFSELGNGSQKVPCCDDWLQAGHWMLLNFAPDTLSHLLPQQLQRVHMRVDATITVFCNQQQRNVK